MSKSYTATELAYESSLYSAPSYKDLYDVPVKSEPKSGFEHLPTKSAKIRAMAAAGWTKGAIAKKLGIRYQFVYGVLNR